MMAEQTAIALTTSIGMGLLLLLYFLYRRLFLDCFRTVCFIFERDGSISLSTLNHRLSSTARCIVR